MKKVEVYLDKKAMGKSKKRIYSIRDTKTGKVILKANYVLLKNVELVVQQGGRQDTLKRLENGSKSKTTKTVHAFLRGELVKRNRSVRELIKSKGIEIGEKFTPVGYMPQITKCWKVLTGYSIKNQKDLDMKSCIEKANTAIMHRDGILITEENLIG